MQIFVLKFQNNLFVMQIKKEDKGFVGIPKVSRKCVDKTSTLSRLYLYLL